jgi:hypothetical protein
MRPRGLKHLLLECGSSLAQLAEACRDHNGGAGATLSQLFDDLRHARRGGGYNCKIGGPRETCNRGCHGAAKELATLGIYKLNMSPEAIGEQITGDHRSYRVLPSAGADYGDGRGCEKGAEVPDRHGLAPFAVALPACAPNSP